MERAMNGGGAILDQALEVDLNRWCFPGSYAWAFICSPDFKPYGSTCPQVCGLTLRPPVAS